MTVTLLQGSREYVRFTDLKLDGVALTAFTYAVLARGALLASAVWAAPNLTATDGVPRFLVDGTWAPGDYAVYVRPTGLADELPIEQVGTVKIVAR